ncbi:TfoX/Sxy family protein [Aquabacterium sp.]|uniref:TfoX/Sxy family protein n=1 Tax=Aquabacterium sp. TaxID=1872578 RepID=UPI002D1A7F8F|nr:TfoX/Sxy family protein [Aquabacterium sp.]HSW08205.1 TfoX/Sxy family protein [Aquabacterium sp.]
MSSADAEFVTHCLELLSPLGHARARRMFGGHGLYVDDLFLALIISDTLYLKTDDSTRSQFQAAGCQPFDYATRDGQRIVMAYWTAPQDAMESPALMLPWGRLAMASALRAAASKRPAAPRKTTARPRQATAATPAPAASRRKAGR